MNEQTECDTSLALGEARARIDELEGRIVALEKTKQALIKQVERSASSSSSNSYSLFMNNLILQRKVAQQTSALQANNMQLSKALGDLRSATDQIIEREKLAALGSLVAGIAHEVNTPLGIGVTAASYLEEITEAQAKAFEAGTMKKSDLAAFIASCQETTRILLTNLNRGAELIQSFKRVVVDQSDETRQTITLATYIKDIIVSLTPKLKKTKIDIIAHCPEDLRVDIMPGFLSQILTNLITNSIAHAFDPGEAGEIAITVKTRDDALVLIYTDNGKGIPATDLRKVFDPFFTTRRGQGGSGLGLSLVHNIVVRKLNGQIDLASTPGKGVRFTITLPDSAAKAVTPVTPE